ncbi:hypothetical protein [Streptomyces bugieae]|uniref:Prephenate dehydrogenase n=1 Tax=Streptomyces bugieae TaxID=3098223 RepID=A0ABU7NKQ7_9ACTN|nr:hypothetical protein [Streptomyces sp. DSM 41528]
MTDSVLLQTIENLKSTLPGLEEQERLLREQLEGVVQRASSTREALEHLRVLTGAAAPVGQSAPATASPGLTPEEPAAVEPAGDAGEDSPEPNVTVAPESAGEPERAASVVPQPRAAASSRAKSNTAKSSATKPSATKASTDKKRATKKTAAKKATPNKATKKTAAPATPKAKKAASKRAATAQPADEGAGKLIDAALAVLKNSGAPMRAREINAALGREATPGQIESVRNTLDRVAKQQKLVTRPGRGTYAAV